MSCNSRDWLVELYGGGAWFGGAFPEADGSVGKAVVWGGTIPDIGGMPEDIPGIDGIGFCVRKWAGKAVELAPPSGTIEVPVAGGTGGIPGAPAAAPAAVAAAALAATETSMLYSEDYKCWSSF